MDLSITNTLKIILPTVVTFFAGIGITPVITHYMYKYNAWKKQAGNKEGLGDDNGTPIFNKLHEKKEVNTPRMGGIIIVISVIFVTALFWLLSYGVTNSVSGKIDFLSRTQTWLPFASFIIGAVIGFVDDLFQIRSTEFFQGGLPFRYRFIPVVIFGILAAWWFYAKLGMSSVFVPFYGQFELGLLFIPFFITVLVAVYASAIIDGLDGLSGGVLSIVFSALGFLALMQSQVDIAAFSFVIVGGTLAFLWFNIPPARFYLGESGFTSLAFSLTIIAFLTNTVMVLPLIAFVQFATVSTNILQVTAKKLGYGKIFKVAPIHHHFEAIGWPDYKVTMRYWIISIVFAIMGIIVFLVG
jgi:phospho-N-acetylmuramoyl-pentapeptide-transferase